ncbi:hypothetical protein BdWA1_001626 [Babesia duncani]|uniref:Uncharacterized protein n=1 Tax=Babesia duncani TaxID=323732 RepID=A0AAD9PKA2_9APIC|nr:hypothetical protein BdWA1_001626 [Babesia duncani]
MCLYFGARSRDAFEVGLDFRNLKIPTRREVVDKLLEMTDNKIKHKSLLETLESLKTEFEAMQQTREKNLEMSASVKIHLSNLQEKLNEQLSSYKYAQSGHNIKLVQIEEITVQLVNSLNKLSVLEKRIEAAKEQVSFTICDHETNVAELAKVMASNKSEVEELERLINDSEIEMAEARNWHLVKQQELDGLNSELADYKSTCGALAIEKQEIKNNISLCNTKLETLNTTLEAKETEFNNIQDDIKAIESHIGPIESSQNTILLQEEKLNTRIVGILINVHKIQDNLYKELQFVTNSIEKSCSEKNTLTSGNHRITARYEMLENILNHINSVKEDVTNQVMRISDLAKIVHDAEYKMGEMLNESKALDCELSSWTCKNLELKAQIEEMEIASSDWEHKHQSSSSILSAKQSHYEIIISECNDLNAEINKSKLAIESFQINYNEIIKRQEAEMQELVNHQRCEYDKLFNYKAQCLRSDLTSKREALLEVFCDIMG